MTKVVVVDSDSIFALYNPNDPLNGKAAGILQQLITQGYQLIYPASVIFEIVSLFQRVLPTQTVTTKLIEMIKNDQILIYVIDEDSLKEAAKIFHPKGSKQNTLIDCSVAAIAKKINADGIFSFDDWFKKLGYKLASEVV